MFDLIIRNGTIIDGSGAPGFRGDIGVKEDRISQIGTLKNERAEREIEAEGKIVCPGFIDVNNHSDTYWRIFLDPQLESLVYQGVTTAIGGNCGASLAPLASPNTLAAIQKWVEIKNVNVNWLSQQEFFDVLERKKLSVNFGSLVGHATLRRGVIGDEVRSLLPQEFEFMKRMLEKALADGALGLSTGLVYSHARLASFDELVGLAKIVEKYDGIYATHLRSEQREIVEAVDEAIRIAKESGVKLHISHLKVMGEKNWPKMKEVFNLIDEARRDGVEVTFDVYPYTTTGSVLYALLPVWVCEGGRKVMLNRLKDPVIRAKVLEEMENSDLDYSKVRIAISPLNRTLTKYSISDIAKSQEKTVEEAVVDTLVASDGMVITSMEVLSEQNVEDALKHPAAILASNGSGYNIAHAGTGDQVHPRNFGAFPRFLEKYAREKKTLGWEEAISKMTGKPAERFGLKKRGQLKKNYFADIVVFDQAKLSSPASIENPYQYAKGVEVVLSNGMVILEGGKYLGVRNGKILKR